MSDADAPAHVDLRVTHYPASGSAPAFTAVVIEPSVGVALEGAEDGPSVPASDAGRVAELEKELQQTREHLRATIEELETTNREQHAANEEMLASNEALQLSEDRLQAVAQTAPDAILTFNDRGKIEFVNRTGCAMFGYGLEAMLGASVGTLLSRESDGEPVRWAQFAAVPDEGGGEVEAVVGACADGQTFPAHVSVGTFTRRGERLYTAVVRDITERREAEARAHESETHFRLMADALPALIAYLDREKRFQFLNAAYERWFGRSASTFVGQRLIDTVDREDTQDLDRRLDEVFQSGQTYACVTAVRTPADQARQVHAIFVPHTGPGGEVLGLYALMTDITELKHAEQALRAANEQLEAKNREMEQFVYTVSHDLKSPLVTISGLLGYLGKEVEEGRTQRVGELTAMLNQTANRMHETIEDLLELSRIGRVSDEPEAIDLTGLVREVVQDAQDEIQQRGARVRVTLDPDLPPVYADPSRLRQVFDNLLTNSLKYGCAEGDARVIIGGHVEGSRVRVFVRDFGPGIDPEHHDRVFALFRRLSTSTVGSGVGLTIVKRVMETLGGQAWIESEPGHGAAFWLDFPPTQPGPSARQE